MLLKKEMSILHEERWHKLEDTQGVTMFAVKLHRSSLMTARTLQKYLLHLVRLSLKTAEEGTGKNC